MNPTIQSSVSEFKTLLGGSKSIAILIPAEPSIDTVASALSLYLALSTQGKETSVVCTSPMTVEFNRLVAVDKITGNLGGGNGKNLVIAFPYEEGSIEKVSYNIDAGYFNLVIEPREGFPLVTPEMLKYSFGGGNIDLIVTMGTTSLETLGPIYLDNQNQFTEKTVVNIDVSPLNQNYGKLNIIDTTTSSISEFMASIFAQLGYQPDSDAGTNLLAGIVAKTNNFTVTTTPATFETVANLMRTGARMLPPLPQNPQPMPNFNRSASMPSPVQQPLRQPLPPRPQNPPIPSQQRTPSHQNMQSQQPVRRPFNPPPLPRNPQPQSRPAPSFNTQHNSYNSQTASQHTAPPAPASGHEETPPDWLKPKIYKGTSTH